MGKRIRGPKPQLRDWTLLFLKKDGRDNRNKIAKRFAEFWDDMDQNVIKITGNCFYGDRSDLLMLLLMHDALEGQLDQRIGYYLHPDYCKMGGYL